jgi:hypothetical protein
MVGYPGRALVVFAWTTLGFAGLELAQSRWRLGRDWDPRKLPKLVKRENRLKPAESLGELLFASAVLLWLLALPSAPWLLLSASADFLEGAPVWGAAYVPIVVVTAATVVLSAVNVMRPYWTPARSAARLAIHGASLLVMVMLLRAGQWGVGKPGATVHELDRVVGVLNMGIEIGLYVACVVVVVEIGKEAWRWRSRVAGENRRAGRSWAG